MKPGTAKPGAYRRPGGSVRLCAEISFDGKLLRPAEHPGREAGPAWWKRLLALRCCVWADIDLPPALFDFGQVDELCLRVRPCVDGRRGQPTLSGPAEDAPFFARSITWDLVRMGTTAGGDCLLHYRRMRG